jgi:predicted Holliday junction resolvase-like endonuclease
MTWALLSLSVLLLAILTPTLIWLHAEVSEGKHLRDRLEEQTKLSEEYRSGRDIEVAAHAVTTDELDKEKYLRAAAEAQRDEALRKSRAYLAQNLRNASEGELNAVVADLFSSPLSVVRPQVPAASSPAANDSDLEKP